ncbi:MAG TPA: MFS transporter [Candidatus Ornithomonoglobus intestinigallinarum]|uniref:MFS transporter n=1 Tax=Candidatus Ornithomonoglobus intestinigallinarum TaxID=2840894 RepID=A0A9D1H3G4_9FIRM|nr:MFS transporter [Candidatus Ornithomonoglobus intestinigallinarum]
MYLLLLAVIYIIFISLGLPDSLLGSAWPTIYETFDVPISYMGFVSVIISGGTVVSGLFSERLILKFGTRAVTITSIFLTAAAMFGFSKSSEFYMLCLWAVPYGLGAGAIDAALNNYVALYYNSRHMSWLHCFWGVGTIISPYIMSYAITHGAWTDGYRAVSYMQVVIAIIALVSLPLWKVNKNGGDGGEERKPVGLKGALKIKGVPYILVGFMCYCAAEATAMLWSSSFLQGARGVTPTRAAAFGALFFIGITAGRFLAGFISDRLGDNRMIRMGACIALAGAALTALPWQATSIAGLVVIGLGCAPIYPSIIHSTPDNFGAENSQSIIGIQMASAYVGSTLMPPLFGIIANHISVALMPFYTAFFTILLVIMISKTEKAAKERREKEIRN